MAHVTRPAVPGKQQSGTTPAPARTTNGGIAALEKWARSFSDATNDDAEIQAHGKYFTCAYMLDMTDARFVVRMVSGKVVDVAVDPGPLDVRYEFAVRASADTWRNFGVPVPKPMYHGIWAASFQRDMKLEGDILVMMQHLRCFTRQIELLRVVGVPV
jgi:hypothetical protein